MAGAKMYETDTLGFAIARPAGEVYEFLLDPANFPIWGFSGEANMRHLSGRDWETETSVGRRIIRFASRNPHGILDVSTFREAGGEALPLGIWVVPNGAGTELVLTCFRHPLVTDAEWSSFRHWLGADFLALQSVLEARGKAEPVFDAKAISVGIARPMQQVYDYLSEPANFASWAFVDDARMVSLGQGEWGVETTVGRRIIKFAPRNDFGILTYQARLSLEDAPHLVPMRVLANGEGTELVYVFLRRPGSSKEAFASLIDWVTADVLVLKSILEADASRR